jgi:transposase
MKRKPPKIVEMDVERLGSLLDRAEQGAFDEEDYATIRQVLESYYYLLLLIDDKSTTIARLRKILFGSSTEKTSQVVGRSKETSDDNGGQDEQQAGDSGKPADGNPPAEKKGHGRRGAGDYPGAKRVKVRHGSLQPGDPCPNCGKGTAYEMTTPGVLIRFVGRPPVDATIYELQKLRCNLCGEIFTAEAPSEAGEEKHDATVVSMIALLKYGSGLPFNRLEGLQGNLGVPLPASTQWDIVSASLDRFRPVYEELIRQAAQGEVVYNDDTRVRILELMPCGTTSEPASPVDPLEQDESPSTGRRGLFTSGVVATAAGRRIALFFSGRQHAGESLAEVLRRRAAELPPPIHMCDALSRNLPGEFETIVGNCLAHARRQFVDVVSRFPDPCRYVLEAFESVYRHDDLARKEQLSPEDRLAFHQAKSGPIMEELHSWMKRQFDERLVEPNSGLGAAINYLRRHWPRLTLFLRQAGAPLDNNICERALKKAILHRKNALFFKTQNGANVGDLYMSLIHTCELSGANAFAYLTEVQRHAAEVAAAPGRWMPWNFRDNLPAA